MQLIKHRVPTLANHIPKRYIPAMVALAEKDPLARKHAPVSPSLLRSESYVGQETHTPDAIATIGLKILQSRAWQVGE